MTFDWRSMGGSAYLPLLVGVMLVLITAANQGELPEILPVLELFFPFFGSWWSIFLLHDVLSKGGNEVLYSYPVPRWKLGFFRVFAYFLFYLALMFVMLLCLSIWIGVESILPLAIQLSTQAFFYSGLGFLAMALTMDTGWSLIVVTAYLSVQVLTRGEILPVLNVYFHNSHPVPIPLLLPALLKTGLFGIAFYLNAQYVLATKLRLK